MIKYRKKPVVIEAVQFSGKWEDVPKMKEFCNCLLETTDLDFKRSYLNIKTLEGNRVVSPRDYIIKGTKGEFHTCKPDIFEMTYEKVVEDD